VAVYRDALMHVAFENLQRPKLTDSTQKPVGATDGCADLFGQQPQGLHASVSPHWQQFKLILEAARC